MTFHTADFCDRFAGQDKLQIVDPLLRCYGGLRRFSGYITTLKVFEDDSLLREALAEKVQDRVLVVDGGGSRRCALVGEALAGQALDNGWQGIVVYGCVRNAESLSRLPIGVMALNAYPLAGHKHDKGERDVMITFAGVNFKKDHYLYADDDGIIVSDTKLD